MNTVFKQQHSALFDLIKSLSKAEKRAFKMSFSGGAGLPVFVELFEVLDKQKEYSEEQAVAAVPRLTRQQLPNVKKYLYAQILHCLNNLNSTGDVQMKALEMLGHIKVLFDKKLYRQCRVLITQAKELAELYEIYAVQLLLMEWEDKLHIINIDMHIKSFDDKKEHRAAHERNEQRKRIADLYRAESELNHFKNQIFISIRTDRFTRKEFTLDYGGTFENHPALNLPGRYFKGFRNEYLRQITSGIYYITVGDTKKSYSHFGNIIRLIEKFPHFRNIDPRMYGIALYNFVLNCNRLDLFDDYYIACIKKLKIEAAAGHVTVSNVQCLELVYYSARGEFEEGLEVAQSIIRYNRDHGLDATFFIEMDLYFDLMYIYFGAGKFEEALEWLNKIINSKAINVVRDLYSVSRIIQLIIHFELGNTLLLAGLSKSLSNYLTTRQRRYQFETCFLNFFHDMAAIEERPAQLALLKKLKVQISALQKNANENRMLEYFAFNCWIDSKIYGNSFPEEVRKAYRKERRSGIKK